MIAPEYLTNEDAEPPAWISKAVAATAEEAIAYGIRVGVIDGRDKHEAHEVLMRRLSPVEARIRGRETEEWWDECTKRAKAPAPYWRIEMVEEG